MNVSSSNNKQLGKAELALFALLTRVG